MSEPSLSDIKSAMAQGPPPKQSPPLPERESFLRGYRAAEARPVMVRIYAYSVCLASVIAFLVAAPRIVGAALDFYDPVNVKRAASQPDISSLDTYRADLQRTMGLREWVAWEREHEGDRGLAEYNAVRGSLYESVSAQAKRSMWSNGILAVLALPLFVFHWFLARRS